MTFRRFLYALGVIFVVCLLLYIFSTPHGSEIVLIGVVDGNEVVVSPQIQGRMTKLYVDEGSEVKTGQLVAELDRTALEAQVAQQAANIASLEAKVAEAKQMHSMTDDQTSASLNQTAAMLTSTRAQLDQARAALWRDQLNYDREQKLFAAGVASVQDRDNAEATYKVSLATVTSLEDQVKAQQAALALAGANRKQVGIQQSELASTVAQLAQARAAKAQAETELGYTYIYAPIDGIVSVRVARQGEVVNAGAPIVTVVDVDHLWVRADVEETYIDSIHFGDRLAVQLPSGSRIEGAVIFKGVEGDYATQRDVSRTKRDIKTFAIKVAVPNPGRRLFTGMTATVLLPQPAKKHWYSASRFGS